MIVMPTGNRLQPEICVFQAFSSLRHLPVFFGYDSVLQNWVPSQVRISYVLCNSDNDQQKYCFRYNDHWVISFRLRYFSWLLYCAADENLNITLQIGPKFDESFQYLSVEFIYSITASEYSMTSNPHGICSVPLFSTVLTPLTSARSWLDLMWPGSRAKAGPINSFSPCVSS